MNKIRSMIKLITKWLSKCFTQEEEKPKNNVSHCDSDKEYLSIKNKSLLPELISKDNDAYHIVEDLKEALEIAFEDRKIKNIALTGAYGSGKSSILDTLQTILPKERNILRLSLATLRVDDTGTDYKEVLLNQKKEREEAEEREETLNRKIEYSILQQLVYHEEAQTVPNSRLRRISHIHPQKLSIYSWGVIVFILAFCIAFEPSLIRIESFYILFNWGCMNILFDVISVIYMLWGIWFVLRKVIATYSNSKLNKLNLKEACIELNENTSIFNQHLDEILYFFQATDYDIVIIEDLDRFGTSNVFLKLRELNFLLNESKVIDRHIVFLYAVKDDIFKDEDRTKFFDYISTVIPVINSSNSKAILKTALKERNVLSDISDDDLSEIAFFIQDMRILKNIANEYTQYCNLLCKQNSHLDRAKLLAMIVYKNYHPQDFALLHRRQGKVYKCLNQKKRFIELALKELDNEKVKLAELKKSIEDNSHLQEHDLRILLLDKLRYQLPENFHKVSIGNDYYTLSEVAKNSILFEELIKTKNVQYKYWYGYGSSYTIKDIDIEALKKEVNYDRRLEAIQATPQSILEMEHSILRKELEIKSYTFKDLFSHFALEECQEYTQIELTPMMDVFLRLGYLNEDYYDYISYFYEGMITQNDRNLFIFMKRNIAQDPSTPIDKVDNFHKELRPYMFQHKAILNNHLLDYVAQNSTESFERIMITIENKDVPLKFLAQYYLLGKEQEKVFKHFITWGNQKSWNIIEKHNNEKEKELLQEALLRYSEGIVDVPNDWLNKNFNFIKSHYEKMGEKRCLALFSNGCFEEITSSNNNILDCIIEHCAFKINSNNLSVIVSYLTNQSVNVEMLNYSWCLSTNNKIFIDHINKNLEETLNLFTHNGKKETPNGILALLNTIEITPDFKETYLSKQENRLTDYTEITEEALVIATRIFLVEPTWNNVIWYFKKNEELTEELISYIEHFGYELSKERLMIKTEDNQNLFENVVLCPNITDSTLSLILKAFTNNLLDEIDVTELSEDRLTILLNNNKFPFTEHNTNILRETPIFGKYLIAHADEIIEIVNSSKKHILDNKTLVEIIKKSTLHKHKLDLVTAMIQNTDDYNEIAELLKLLGGSYAEIVDREKRPKLDKNISNENLLNLLINRGFVSSFSEDKDGVSWRIYPPRT